MNLNLKSCMKALALVALGALAIGFGAGAAKAQSCGNAKIANVTPASSTKSGVNQFWNVSPGGTVTITLSGVTDCANKGTDSTIQVIVQSSATGNVCRTATKGATAGCYTFTYDVPNNGCGTMVISYCTSNCSTSTGKFAKDAAGNCQGHLRVGSSTGVACTPTISGCKDTDLGCQTADPTITCDNAGTLGGYSVTGSTTCGGTLPVSCTAGTATGDACSRSQTFTYAASNACGQSAVCYAKFTWSVHTAPVLANLPTGGDLGCNPTPPTCSTAVTASDNCSSVPVRCFPGPVLGDPCSRSQTFTYSAKNCAGQKTSQDVTYTWKEDTTPPAFDNLPAGGDLGCNPTLPSCDPTVTATDTCDGKVDVHCSAGPIIGSAFHSTTAIPYGSTGYKYTVVGHGVGAGFEAPGFDDSAFSTGNAGFGSIETPGCPLVPVTEWTLNTDILVRKSFHLPPGAKNLTVGIAIDNDVQVFINGHDISGGIISHENCASQDSFVFNCPDNYLLADNVLAIRGVDRGVISYLDAQVKFDDPCELTQTFTYSAIDSCKNPVSQDVTYTWSVGNVTISCPPDANLCLKDFVPGDTDLTGVATATVSCSHTADVSFVDSVHTPITCPGDSTPGFTFIRTWTATSLCGTATCDQLITVCACNPQCVPFGQGCTVTLGFWKTHGPGLCVQGKNKNVWPVGDIQVNGYTYNTVTDAATICSLLSASGQALVPQLIAAQLNLLNGANGSSIQAVINAAIACTAAGNCDATTIDALTSALNDFNSGVTGPGHCGSCP